MIRDHNRAFLAGLCHVFPHTEDPEAAEVLACRRTLQVVDEMGEQNIHLEPDSLKVVQMIQQEGTNYSAVGPWIKEIKQMLETKHGVVGSSISESRRA